MSRVQVDASNLVTSSVVPASWGSGETKLPISVIIRYHQTSDPVGWGQTGAPTSIFSLSYTGDHNTGFWLGWNPSNGQTYWLLQDTGSYTAYWVWRHTSNSTPNPPPFNQDNVIVMTYDPSVLASNDAEFWVNGVQETLSTLVPPVYPSSIPDFDYTVLGGPKGVGTWGGGVASMVGRHAEYSVLNRIISDDEIAAVSAGASPLSWSGLEYHVGWIRGSAFSVMGGPSIAETGQTDSDTHQRIFNPGG